jgi:hypothetical protein
VHPGRGSCAAVQDTGVSGHVALSGACGSLSGSSLAYFSRENVFSSARTTSSESPFARLSGKILLSTTRASRKEQPVAYFSARRVRNSRYAGYPSSCRLR